LFIHNVITSILHKQKQTLYEKYLSTKSCDIFYMLIFLTKWVNCPLRNNCFCLQRTGRMILPHLLYCEELAVCLYSSALHASHLRQTYAMQNEGITLFQLTYEMSCPGASVFPRWSVGINLNLLVK